MNGEAVLIDLCKSDYGQLAADLAFLEMGAKHKMKKSRG